MLEYPEFVWEKVKDHDVYLCSFLIDGYNQHVGYIRDCKDFWIPTLMKRFDNIRKQLDTVETREEAEKLVIKFGKGVRYREFKKLRIKQGWESTFGKPKYGYRL